MNTKPIVEATSYEQLYQKWHNTMLPRPSVVVYLFFTIQGIAGAATFGKTEFPLIAVVCALFSLLFAVWLASDLSKHFIGGYYLDASFELEPIDPQFPHGFKRIASMHFQVLPQGSNPTTPPKSDVRIRMPISGRANLYAEQIVGTRRREFLGRCLCIAPNHVIVMVTSNPNTVTMTLNQIVGIITRHERSIGDQVYDIGGLYAASLAAHEVDRIRRLASEIEKLYAQTRQVAKSKFAGEIKTHLAEIRHITCSANFISAEVRTPPTPDPPV